MNTGVIIAFVILILFIIVFLIWLLLFRSRPLIPLVDPITPPPDLPVFPPPRYVTLYERMFVLLGEINEKFDFLLSEGNELLRSSDCLQNGMTLLEFSERFNLQLFQANFFKALIVVNNIAIQPVNVLFQNSTRNLAFATVGIIPEQENFMNLKNAYIETFDNATLSATCTETVRNPIINVLTSLEIELE